MEAHQLLERFDHLIQMGETVIATKYMPPRGAIYFVDSSLCQQWRASALSLLNMAFSKNSIQFEEFNSRCVSQRQSEAESGLATLRAAKEDIEAGIEFAVETKEFDIEQLPLHPRIASVAVDLYRDGHFDNAVLDACKALINFVKERSRLDDLDGSGLMTTVFSKNNPILAFNDGANQSDGDEQEGMMHLYLGVALALRNPRSHGFMKDSPERALEYISFISMLAHRLEETTRMVDVKGRT